MTAAILQFNQNIRHTKQTQSNNQSDYIDTPMTKEYHQIMIDLLNTEHPFRAVRLAEEFNRENGFCLIDEGIIRKWRRELKKQNRQKENSQIKIVETKIPRLKCGNRQIENHQIENPENKLQQLEEGYIKLLSAQNHDIGTIVT